MKAGAAAKRPRTGGTAGPDVESTAAAVQRGSGPVKHRSGTAERARRADAAPNNAGVSSFS